MNPPLSIWNIARRQALAALLALSALGVVLGGLACCVRSPALAAWVDRKNEESCRQTRDLLYHRGWFQAPEELWMYDALPPPDTSKGGVYFLGSSYVLYSTMLWQLPPGIQALVHNYGMPASNARSELLLLRYLSENKGALSGPGEKSLVIFGAAYQTASYPCRTLPPPWVNAWERHGLFACDPERGVRALPVNPIYRFIELEETRQASFLTRCQNIAAHGFSRWRHHGAEPPRVHNPAAYIAHRRAEMGPDWKQRLSDAIQVFGQTADWLQARHVQMRVIFMPEGTWEDQLPYSAEYRRQLAEFCAQRHIPVTDWSRLLTDDDLADSAHPDIYGMEKIQKAFMAIALPFLRSTQALPPDN